MKVVNLETFIANVPYKRTEISSMVFRGGVTSVIVKLTTDDGLVGWGEACSGADVYSVEAAVKSMFPFIKERSPWDSSVIQQDVFHRGLWAFRAGTGNYAWAAIDMALWDLCGKQVKLPVYKLLGGAVSSEVDYFYYLSHGSLNDVEEQCKYGLSLGYETYYLKTGIDIDHEISMVEVIRRTVGNKNRIRLDSNGAWSLSEANKNIKSLDKFNIDFIEQPVREHPMSLMANLRTKSPVALAANEGLWSEIDAIRLITNEVADVYTFSPYWVGSLAKFRDISYVASAMGSKVCRHTHGEMGIAATAFHHVSLTIPNLVLGNQQTAAHIEEDILEIDVPITNSPKWGLPTGVGLGLEIDQNSLNNAIDRFNLEGQYLPYGKI